MRSKIIFNALLLALGILVLGATCPQKLSLEKFPSAKEQDLLQKAEDYFDQGDYQAAASAAEELIRQHPDSRLLQRSRFILARSYLEAGMITEAKAELESYIQDYFHNDDLVLAQQYLRGIEKLIYEQEIDNAHQTYKALEESNYRLTKINKDLRKTIDEEKIYLEIDLADDLLHVKMSSQLLYSYPIVTGKGKVRLKTSGKLKDFSTPKGVWTILGREKNPVWYRPDWSWLEKGEELPENLTKEDRATEGVLGPYRLNLGQGYAIHGTASGRIRPGKYSHGCIRMNNNELEEIYKMTEVGTKVYIY